MHWSLYPGIENWRRGLRKSEKYDRLVAGARHKYTNIEVAVKIINKKTMKAKKMIAKVSAFILRSRGR